MLLQRLSRRRRLRLAGIVLAILSVGNLPLPRPDLHVIRHQDGPGQVCELHDHLRYWHPEAGETGDAVVLHFHWALLHPQRPTDGADAEGSTLRSMPCDRFAMLGEDVTVAPIDPPRWPGRPPAAQPDRLDGRAFAWASSRSPRAGPRPSLVVAPPQPLASMLQRWIC